MPSRARRLLIGVLGMLKIEVTENQEGGVTVRLHGRMVGPWVDEVRRTCEPFLGNRRALTLDFSGVSFVAQDGVALCRSLRQGRATLTNCSPFVKEQLNA